MPKRSRTTDPILIANRIFKQATGSTKNAAAVALGSSGGKKGGPARAKALTAERRREIASEAAKARWSRS